MFSFLWTAIWDVLRSFICRLAIVCHILDFLILHAHFLFFPPHLLCLVCHWDFVRNSLERLDIFLQLLCGRVTCKVALWSILYFVISCILVIYYLVEVFIKMSQCGNENKLSTLVLFIIAVFLFIFYYISWSSDQLYS